MKTRINRRTLLKGVLAGSTVSVGLPTLEAMLNSNGTALAQGAPLPRRLGIFFWGNGVRLNLWTPPTSPNWTPTPTLMPLLPVKDYINVVSGLDIKIPRARVHHTGTIGMLSGAPVVVQPKGSATYRSTFSKPSIDQIAAAELGKTTRFKSLEVGISRRVRKDEGVTPQVLSHNGPNSGNPPSYEPREIFTRLFGAGLPTPMGGGMAPDSSAIAKATIMRRSVLDVVVGDIGRLKLRVGGSDKRRLEQHFENVRAIEKRIQGPEGQPGMPQANPVPGCAPGAAPGDFPNTPQGEPFEPLTIAMSELVALALACDQTRVFSVLFTGSIGGTVFWPAGVMRGHHQLTHDEPGVQPQIQATTVFTMKMLSILLQKLKDTPDGAGNLLDSCAILATSDVSEGKTHSIRDFPILVAGRAGGYFKYPGIHHREVGGNTSTVLMSMLRSVGLTPPEVGAGTGRATTSLSAIEGG